MAVGRDNRSLLAHVVGGTWVHSFPMETGKKGHKKTWEKTMGKRSGCLVFQSLRDSFAAEKQPYYIQFQTGCFIGVPVVSDDNPYSINMSSSITLYLIPRTMFLWCSFAIYEHMFPL